MEDGENRIALLRHPRSSILHPLLLNHAAIATLPPWRLVGTGAHAGPACLAPLNHIAVSHTLVPPASVSGNSTFRRTLPVFPSNVQLEISEGGAAPTKLNTAAPSTPRGLPRRAVSTESLRRMRTVHPLTTCTISAGGFAG